MIRTPAEENRGKEEVRLEGRDVKRQRCTS